MSIYFNHTENIQNVVEVGNYLQKMIRAQPTQGHEEETMTTTTLKHAFEALKLCLTHQSGDRVTHNASLLHMTLEHDGNETHDCALTKTQREVGMFPLM
jgi:hypothetical protein